MESSAYKKSFVFLIPGVACTYCTCQVDIILVGLASRFKCGRKAAVAKGVGTVAAHKINSTVVVSGVAIVWLCTDVRRV